MYITLSADDAARLGAPSRLEIDLERVMVREAIDLQRHTGLTPDKLAAEFTAGSLDALVALVWLALRRAGVLAEYDSLDFNLAAIEFVDDEPAPGPGKARRSPRKSTRTNRS